MNLLYFVLCCYGLTLVGVYGKILDPIRPTKGFFGELFECPMCFGFWVGVFIAGLNPFTELFTFDVTLVNLFLLGCLSSGTSYSLCMLISDGGIQHEHEHRHRGSLDTKVDAKTSSKVLQG